jgi:hypothetical protein
MLKMKMEKGLLAEKMIILLAFVGDLSKPLMAFL